VKKTQSRMAERTFRQKPSSQLLVVIGVFLALIVGLVAINWAGELRGYYTSHLIAGRDLGFVSLLGVGLIWLVRRQKYRGQLTIYTAAVLLFSVGLLVQYRLFSDPEYGAKGGERAEQRRNKGGAVRLLNVETGYDDQKKAFLFGAGGIPREASTDRSEADYSIRTMLTSSTTYVPLAAIAAMMVTFLAFKRDGLLSWVQGHSLIIGLLTLIGFSVMVLGSDEGKFLGQTTPWEIVKTLFLLSFAGLLTDTYQRLRRTRWGLPPLRRFLPFAVIAAMPLLPFFALSDFGQMLVFLGVYVTLYFIAIQKKAQLAYGIVLVILLFGVFYTAASIGSGAGIPRRVYFRFYQWAHTWEPPAPDTWWWKRDYERYLQAKRLTPDTNNPVEVRQRNAEAWADRVLQQSQGLFGINEGGVLGRGLGLGFPETIPVSDSDFIYAALAEETGLAGGIVVLIGLAVLVLAGISISIECEDMFTKLLAAGISAFVGFQAVVNVGGVLRLLPMTGITLPFVSHGGWSLITSFSMLGLLLSISHRNALVGALSQLSPDGRKVDAAKSHRKIVTT
jgi:cell division protein FtsW (lipid II flippase)